MRPRHLFAPIDVVIALVLLPSTLVALMRSATVRRDRKTPGTLLHLSSEASRAAVRRKFGSLDFFFAYDGTAAEGLFRHQVMAWYPGDEDGDEVHGGWTIHERRKAWGWGAFTGAMRLLRFLAGVIGRENVTAIRAWNPHISGFLGWILARTAGIPFGISLHADREKRHGLDPGRGAPTILGFRAPARALEGFLLRRADLVLPIRDSLADRARALGVPADRIRVIPHGIDLAPFDRAPARDARAAWNLPPGVPILSFAARLEKENYVDDVLAVAREVAARGRDFLLVIAGDGTQARRLEAEVRADDRLASRVRFLGFQSREAVIELRRISFASLCLMGGFSLVEACAAGRPVVSYDVEWHGELVRTGETGALVPERDIASAADAIARWIDDPAEADRLGARAREVAFERHDIRKTAAIKRRAYAEFLRTATP